MAVRPADAARAIEELRRWARRNWVFTLVALAGLVLRCLTWMAYRPAILYIDSFRYLNNLALRPNQLNPIGYDVPLAPLALTGGLSLVSAVQHLLGMAIAGVGYVLLLRLGARRWVAGLATVAVLLDGYQLEIEQAVMSEVWFEAVLLAVLWLLLRRGPPGWKRAGAAGFLVGAAVLLRLIGIVVALPVLCYLIVAGGALATRAWRTIAVRVLAGALGLLIVLVPYAGYFRAVTGHWGLSVSSGNVLYGRAATVADCPHLDLPRVLRVYCPDEPLGHRAGVDVYAHADAIKPGWPGPLPPGADRMRLASKFGKQVMLQQPFDVAGGMLYDFAKGFAPRRETFHNDVPVNRWQFQPGYPHYPGYPYADEFTSRFGERATVRPDLTAFLRGYQLGVGYMPGPVLAAAGLLGVAGAVGLGRARREGLRSAAALSTGAALILMAGSAAFEFSWRYQLPGLVLWPIAGAIGVTALFGTRSVSDTTTDVAKRLRQQRIRPQQRGHTVRYRGNA